MTEPVSRARVSSEPLACAVAACSLRQAGLLAGGRAACLPAPPCTPAVPAVVLLDLTMLVPRLASHHTRPPCPSRMPPSTSPQTRRSTRSAAASTSATPAGPALAAPLCATMSGWWCPSTAACLGRPPCGPRSTPAARSAAASTPPRGWTSTLVGGGWGGPGGQGRPTAAEASRPPRRV